MDYKNVSEEMSKQIVERKMTRINYDLLARKIGREGNKILVHAHRDLLSYSRRNYIYLVI